MNSMLNRLNISTAITVKREEQCSHLDFMQSQWLCDISNKLDWACIEEKSDPLDICREDPNVKIMGNIQHSISRILA